MSSSQQRRQLMPRFQPCVFAATIIALCWLAMQAVHELGHVLGAVLTGGEVERVVLFPLELSRTDVAPNPHPAVVVWLGPIVGCVVPFGIFMRHASQLDVHAANRSILRGLFVCVANGAYIGVGSLTLVGDCGEMVRSGAPPWVLWLFGAVTIPVGLYQWHVLGSVRDFFDRPAAVSWRANGVALGVLAAVVAIECRLSPR